MGHEYSNGEVPSTNGDTNTRMGEAVIREFVRNSWMGFSIGKYRPRMGHEYSNGEVPSTNGDTNIRMDEAVVREFVRNSWMGFSTGKYRPRMGTRMHEWARRLFVNS